MASMERGMAIKVLLMGRLRKVINPTDSHAFERLLQELNRIGRQFSG